MVEAVILGAAIGVLLRICWTDFYYLKIYNRDLGVLLAILVVFLVIVRPEAILLRLALGALLFAVGFAFWLWGKLGAGDAKLFGIVGCFIAPGQALLLMVLILGLSLAILIFYYKAAMLRFLPVMAGRRIVKLMEMRRVPYGVSISLATIILLGHRLLGAL
jgi:prepilin peptidase CpaA